MTNDELLKYALENGIIDTNHIQEQIEMNERKKYLETHSHRMDIIAHMLTTNTQREV